MYLVSKVFYENSVCNYVHKTVLATCIKYNNTELYD